MQQAQLRCPNQALRAAHFRTGEGPVLSADARDCAGLTARYSVLQCDVGERKVSSDQCAGVSFVRRN